MAGKHIGVDPRELHETGDGYVWRARALALMDAEAEVSRSRNRSTRAAQRRQRVMSGQ